MIGAKGAAVAAKKVSKQPSIKSRIIDVENIVNYKIHLILQLKCMILNVHFVMVMLMVIMQ